MSIVTKAFSASGPIMRLLIGAGAFALLIVGLKQRKKHGRGSPQRPSTKGEDAGAP